MRWLLKFIGFFGLGGALRVSHHHHNTTTDSNDADDVQFHVTKLLNEKNTQYYGPTKIGGQEVMAIFDTGSFELLVMSTRCETCAATPYDHTLSTTFKNN